MAEEELARQEEEERVQAQRIMELEEQQDLKEERYASVHDEVESKSRKLKRLTKRISQSEGELVDIQREFESERTDLLDSIRELTQQLKLKNLIISCCIPEDHIQRIFNNAVFNQEEEEWQILDSQLTGNQIRAKTRGEPMGSQRQQAAAYERMASALQEMEEAHGGKIDVNNEHVRATLEAIANDFDQSAVEPKQEIFFSYNGNGEADGGDTYHKSNGGGGSSSDARGGGSRHQAHRRKSISSGASGSRSSSRSDGRRSSVGRRHSISSTATSIGSLDEHVANI